MVELARADAQRLCPLRLLFLEIVRKPAVLRRERLLELRLLLANLLELDALPGLLQPAFLRQSLLGQLLLTPAQLATERQLLAVEPKLFAKLRLLGGHALTLQRLRLTKLRPALLNLLRAKAHFLLAQTQLAQLPRDLRQRRERLLPATLTSLGLLGEELRLQPRHRAGLLASQISHPASANGRCGQTPTRQLLVQGLLLRAELGLELGLLRLPELLELGRGIARRLRYRLPELLLELPQEPLKGLRLWCRSRRSGRTRRGWGRSRGRLRHARGRGGRLRLELLLQPLEHLGLLWGRSGRWRSRTRLSLLLHLRKRRRGTLLGLLPTLLLLIVRLGLLTEHGANPGPRPLLACARGAEEVGVATGGHVLPPGHEHGGKPVGLILLALPLRR